MNDMKFVIVDRDNVYSAPIRGLKGTGGCGHDASEFDCVSHRTRGDAEVWRVKCGVCGHVEEVFEE